MRLSRAVPSGGPVAAVGVRVQDRQGVFDFYRTKVLPQLRG
ncbi:hypothetical protein ABT278_42250 [Streptomyces sp. NPDC001228]